MKSLKTRKRARFVPDLPDEVITTHIFSRLSVKSVGRCRCVSKHWRFLLSTPEFAKMHLKFHSDDPENLVIYCYKGLQILTFTGKDAVSRKLRRTKFKAFIRRRGIPRKVKLRLSDRDVHYEMVGSCDGLILIKTNVKHFGVILLNPTTREYVSLPKAYSNEDLSMSLTYGLGYDSSSDDYKVVKLSYSRDCRSLRLRVDVYSVKMKHWRRVQDTPYPHRDLNPGVLVNGFIHWICGGFPLKRPITIAAFNLAREKFSQVPLPSSVAVKKPDILKIKVLEGRLTLIRDVEKGWGDVDVWVMKEYGISDSWTKLTTIKWPCGCLYQSSNIFSCMLNGDEILVLRNSSQLLAYNWRTRVWRDVVVSGFKRPFGYTWIMTSRESIVSPNSQF